MAEIIENEFENTNNISMRVNNDLTLGIINTALNGISAFGRFGGVQGFASQRSHQSDLTNEDVYLERLIACDKLEGQKEMYENKLSNLRELTDAFFQSYKRDVDNSFNLYKYTRDSNDILMSKIDKVDKKVDIMAAVRPYQDALIDQKINTNALISDFNLARRTCKMIEGQLVLPAEPVVTGYGSYPNCNGRS